MNNKVIGFIVVCADKKGGLNGGTYPLGYGQDPQPEPDMLARDRGATIFDNKAQAWEKLGATLIKATDLGHEWPAKFVYDVVEIHKPDAD